MANGDKVGNLGLPIEDQCDGPSGVGNPERERPSWASEFYRDGQGIWVGTDVTAFEIVPDTSQQPSNSAMLAESTHGNSPEARISPERLPRFSSCRHCTHQLLIYPPWATRLDKDEYGLYAILELASGCETRMRWIPPGRFLMGSPDDEKGRWEHERSKHWVELVNGFWLADAPCTQAEWEGVMGNNPSHFKGNAQRPVELVSWYECREFCRRVKERIRTFDVRLPTEAEWEYACRAGTLSAYNDGSDCTEPEGDDPAPRNLGWLKANSGAETHPVRDQQMKPNAWGLFDTHGNVWEWCADYCPDRFPGYQGSHRVVRGGSWNNTPGEVRSAHHIGWHAVGRDDNVGFRLAASQPFQALRVGREQGATEAAREGRRPRDEEERQRPVHDHVDFQELLLPTTPIGGSTIVSAKKARTPAIENREEPIFETLKLITIQDKNDQTRNPSWRFKIKFLFFNATPREVVLDNVYAEIYERFVATSPQLTIGYVGAMKLLSDNSLQKKEGHGYSCKPGDGFEIVLNLQASSNEFALMVVFGLFVDYYTVPPTVIRSSIPSDHVYAFVNGSDKLPNAGQLHILDADSIQAMRSVKFQNEEPNDIVSNLDLIVRHHASLRPIPKL